MKREDIPAMLKPMPSQSQSAATSLRYVDVENPRALIDEANACVWRAKALVDALACATIKDAGDDALPAFSAVLSMLLNDADALMELAELREREINR